MRLLRHLPLLLCMICCLPLLASAAERPANEQARIEALFRAMLNSHAVFVRNGDAHAAEEAVEHLQNKLDYAGDRIQTAEAFIEHLATASSFSGKPYIIRLPDGTETPSGEWLRNALNAYDTP